MYKPAQARELAAQNRKGRARPAFARQPGAVPSFVSCGRSVRGVALGATPTDGPAGALPGLSRRLRVPGRSGHPHLTPLRPAPASAAPGPATPAARRRPENHPNPARLAPSTRVRFPAPPSSQQRHRCAVALQAHGARLAALAMRRHVPRPPTLRRALRRAQPRLVRLVVVPMDSAARRPSPSVTCITWRGRGRLVVAAGGAR